MYSGAVAAAAGACPSFVNVGKSPGASLQGSSVSNNNLVLITNIHRDKTKKLNIALVSVTSNNCYNNNNNLKDGTR